MIVKTNIKVPAPNTENVLESFKLFQDNEGNIGIKLPSQKADGIIFWMQIFNNGDDGTRPYWDHGIAEQKIKSFRYLNPDESVTLSNS